MFSPSSRKSFALTALALMGTSIFGSVAAKANFSCRDYYSAYVAQATEPAPVVIVDARPNYHGHYAEYHEYHGDYHGGGHDEGRGDDHGGGGGGNDGDAAAAAIAVIGIAALLSTTTAAQDAELQDASNVISDIDQAQMGDGAQLRQLQAKVQADMPKGKVASLNAVAAWVNIDNQNGSFCPAGNLDSEDELAASIAASIAAN